MLHTFTKKGLRGFTLIELLVVIAIIGLLSTVIAAPITEARKKGRDAKKIADLRSIVTAINIYADDNGGVYPATISDLVPRYIPNMPANAVTSTIGRDKYMYTAFTDSGANGKIVAYHIGVKLESGNQGLNDDADCGGADAALTGNPRPCVGDATSGAAVPVCLGSGTCAPVRGNYSTGEAGSPASSGASADFGSGPADTGTTTCTSALTNCIYDLTN